MSRMTSRATTLLTLVLVCLLSGCASLGSQAAGGPGQKLDPWESWNRKVFAFNEDLDAAVLKPVSTAYSNVVPQPVRRGVQNFFSNFADAWSGINNLLQVKPANALQDFARFGTNTIFGVFGVIDVASELGLDHQYEDFGKTLQRWSVGPGAYVVWPLLGPSTVRESFALPFDRLFSPALLLNNGRAQFATVGLQLINTRANLLGASSMIDDIALDKYIFIRDAYLQRRGSLNLEADVSGADAADDAKSPPSKPPGAASAPSQ